VQVADGGRRQRELAGPHLEALGELLVHFQLDLLVFGVLIVKEALLFHGGETLAGLKRVLVRLTYLCMQCDRDACKWGCLRQLCSE